MIDINLHNVGVDGRGRVYICDRENDRIQRFDSDGSFVDMWTDTTRPSGVCVQGDLVYALDNAGRGSRITVYSTEGDVVSRFDQTDFGDPGHLKTGHGICVGHDGSIYVTEVINPQQVTKLQRV